MSLLDSDEEDGVDCEQQLEEEATAGYGHSLGRVGAGSAIPMPPRAVLPETTMENGPGPSPISSAIPSLSPVYSFTVAALLPPTAFAKMGSRSTGSARAMLVTLIW